MSDQLFSSHWYRVAKVKIALRSHVRVHQHSYRGNTWYILRDDSSGRHHRFNEVAYTCEKLAHGTPSGIDNTLATYAQPMLFRNANVVDFEALDIGEPLPLLIAICEQRGSTLEQVAGVRARYESSREPYEAIFEQIDALSTAGAAALLDRDFGKLGHLMNINQGLLNAIGVSTPDLEIMVDIARAAGAVGAKLTGAGGGGSIVALCPEKTPQVGSALRAEGYRVMDLTKGREKT